MGKINILDVLKLVVSKEAKAGDEIKADIYYTLISGKFTQVTDNKAVL